MTFPIGALYFPLYFIAAWAMADRNLAAGLKYHMPLSLRYGCCCIRYFWVSDLLFGSIALPFAIFGSQKITGPLLSNLGESYQGLWAIIYPISFVLMGFLWPKLSNIGISSKQDMPISIAGLRDRFLGTTKLKSINEHLQREVETWVDRVIDAVRADPQTFENFLRRRFQLAWAGNSKPSEENLDALRRELLTQAEMDLGSLYESICRVKMITFRDRGKPLMKVPEMTFEEEQALYDAGITTIRRLRSLPDGLISSISPARIAHLRNNARQFLSQRAKSAAGSIAVIAAMLICIAWASNVYTGSPKAGKAVASPKQDNVEKLKNTGAYKF